MIFLKISGIDINLCHTNCLYLGIWMFKRQISFNLNVPCGTLFSLLDKQDMDSVRQCCSMCLLKVKKIFLTDNRQLYLGVFDVFSMNLKQQSGM
jgi:hypothetical protein